MTVLNIIISGSDCLTKKVLPILLFILFFSSGCNLKPQSIDQMAFKAKKDRIFEKYPKIPHDEILQQISGNRLYGDLCEIYKNDLITLKTETDIDCARLVVVILTPEVGKAITLANSFGIPYIIKSCDNIGIDCIDLSPMIATKEFTDITQAPQDGHWSKGGAAYVADLLTDIIKNYDTVRSSKKFTQGKKPETFGDLTPNRDEILDGEKDMPYHLKANAQGLRMDHNITFPKKKQTILFLGDSQVFSPFLDNPFIPTAILQKRFPDKEILNAGIISYTMEDYESLYRDKARYAEPDLVIVCTNGGDIIDNYFTQRNRFSRKQKIYYPTEVEAQFYDRLYNNK